VVLRYSIEIERSADRGLIEPRTLAREQPPTDSVRSSRIRTGGPGRTNRDDTGL